MFECVLAFSRRCSASGETASNALLDRSSRVDKSLLCPSPADAARPPRPSARITLANGAKRRGRASTPSLAGAVSDLRPIPPNRPEGAARAFAVPRFEEDVGRNVCGPP